MIDSNAFASLETKPAFKAYFHLELDYAWLILTPKLLAIKET